MVIFLYENRRYDDAFVQLKDSISLQYDHVELAYSNSPLEKKILTPELRNEVDFFSGLKLEAWILAYYLLIKCYIAKQKTDIAERTVSDFERAINKRWKLDNELAFSILAYSYKSVLMYDEAINYFMEAYNKNQEYTLAEKNRMACIDAIRQRNESISKNPALQNELKSQISSLVFNNFFCVVVFQVILSLKLMKMTMTQNLKYQELS